MLVPNMNGHFMLRNYTTNCGSISETNPHPFTPDGGWSDRQTDRQTGGCQVTELRCSESKQCAGLYQHTLKMAQWADPPVSASWFKYPHALNELHFWLVYVAPGASCAGPRNHSSRNCSRSNITALWVKSMLLEQLGRTDADWFQTRHNPQRRQWAKLCKGWHSTTQNTFKYAHICIHSLIWNDSTYQIRTTMKSGRYILNYKI
jgi:hypothetical protein